MIYWIISPKAGNEEESKHISDKFYEDFYGLKINSSDDFDKDKHEKGVESDGNNDSNYNESSKNIDSKSMDNSADDGKGKAKFVSLDNF